MNFELEIRIFLFSQFLNNLNQTQFHLYSKLQTGFDPTLILWVQHSVLRPNQLECLVCDIFFQNLSNTIKGASSIGNYYYHFLWWEGMCNIIFEKKNGLSGSTEVEYRSHFSRQVWQPISFFKRWFSFPYSPRKKSVSKIKKFYHFKVGKKFVTIFCY